MQVLLQLAISLSGCYGFFGALTCALCVACAGDAATVCGPAHHARTRTRRVLMVAVPLQARVLGPLGLLPAGLAQAAPVPTSALLRPAWAASPGVSMALVAVAWVQICVLGCVAALVAAEYYGCFARDLSPERERHVTDELHAAVAPLHVRPTTLEPAPCRTCSVCCAPSWHLLRLLRPILLASSCRLGRTTACSRA